MSSPYQSVHDLTNASVKRLVRYLYLPVEHSIAKPPKSWLREQEETMKQLPTACLRPRSKTNVVSVVTRGLMKISEKYNPSFTPPAAVLCSSHRGLNPWTIHALFALVLKEITVETASLRHDRQRDRGPEFTPLIQEFVRRLDGIQALWMDTYNFELLYGRQPKVLSHVNSHCEACILSALGSRPSFLGDLRANLIARTKRTSPCLQRIVDAWINEFPEAAQREVFKRSANLAEEIRAMLKDVKAARQQRREAKVHQKQARGSENASSGIRKTSGRDAPRSNPDEQSTASGPPSTTLSEDPFADPDDENPDNENRPWQDAVGDYYERLARQNGNERAFDRSSLHPAFGGSAAQPDAQFRRDFGTGKEVDRKEQGALWDDAVANSPARSEQRLPASDFPPSMIQDDARRRDRFRHVDSTDSEPRTPRPTTPPAATLPPPFRGYGTAAPSSSSYTDASVYSNSEPARPHPTTESLASIVTAWPDVTSRSSSARRPRGPRPGGLVSTSSPSPQNDNVVTQDRRRATDSKFTPPRGFEMSPTEAAWYLAEEERVARLEEMGRIGRPDFKDHVDSRAAASEAGSDQYENGLRTPTAGSTQAGTWAPSSRERPVRDMSRGDDDDDWRSVATVGRRPPLSEASTIYPDDSYSWANLRRW
ncbi:hypothetical protein CPAR01_03232 [Colletotrichum paranaense]|uniref:VHS domain-containing protein n=1 Tax=Colletotrichum paranaense TaxID=1914294 RepID=A0ABQ9T1S3_9PEZI|nr:uncharacterized protein CPAR01_03232 [Colletotrichum paranaense]KAK1545730.1 hypothetical protein CPAR01_03232 [Colletotrichum paranaense]